jgi:hypothetical protein
METGFEKIMLNKRTGSRASPRLLDVMHHHPRPLYPAAPPADGAAAIRAEGFVLYPAPFVRGRISPFGALATVRVRRRIYRLAALRGSTTWFRRLTLFRLGGRAADG